MLGVCGGVCEAGGVWVENTLNASGQGAKTNCPQWPPTGCLCAVVLPDMCMQHHICLPRLGISTLCPACLGPLSCFLLLLLSLLVLLLVLLLLHNNNRARELKHLIDREQLFLTDIGKSACEAAARANMSHEWRLAFGGQLLQASTLGELV